MPYFQQSEGATVNGGTYIDINGSGNAIKIGPDTRKGEGIKLLLNSYVQPEAIHHSGARGTLGCYPGTREEYIRNITSWVGRERVSRKRVLLITGPAGAGKSAIARTCSHMIEAAGNLGASFFFFRPSGWNDPTKFIPTIVYQLTTRYPAYRACIDTIILDDPLVLQAALNIQFRELLVKPVQKLIADGHGIGEDMVIIVDGLDECATVDAQVQIINVVAASIHEQTTPFLWAFFSRPEPPITSAFSSKIATNISWKLPLTLAGHEAESDIEEYLRGSFQAIRAKYSIPAGVSWPMEEDIRCLVSQSAGLFIYAVTVIRYIDGLGKGTSGLEERLRTVLQLDSKSTDSPFSALDQLYVLIMTLIPKGVLYDTLSLLHLSRSVAVYKCEQALRIYFQETRLGVLSYCFALGLSSAAFHVAISNLYSVLEVTISESGAPNDFQFYHKSFLDFLLDPKRSKQYFIRSLAVHQHCLEMIVRTMSTVEDADSINKQTVTGLTLQAFFMMVEEHDGKLEEHILQQISRVNWNRWGRAHPNKYEVNFKILFQKIPKNWRPKIVRPYRKGLRGILRQALFIIKPGRFNKADYILGKGDKKGLIMRVNRPRSFVYGFS